MSRAEAIARRAEIEVTASPHALLGFLTVIHPGLDGPLRVVSDVTDFEVGGLLFTGIPFGFRLISDSEDQPRGQLVMQNVDRRIGAALRGLRGRADLTLEVRSTADFDLSVVPRVPLGADAPIYRCEAFTLRDVSGDAVQITGSVQRVDFAAEPWPSVRAIAARMPGLFRS